MSNYDIIKDIKEWIDNVEYKLKHLDFEKAKNQILTFDLVDLLELAEQIEDESSTRYKTRMEMLKLISEKRFEVKEDENNICVITYEEKDKEKKYPTKTFFRKKERSDDLSTK